MIILRSIAETRKALDEWRRQGRSIALVPTMGYLHEGHLSLVDEAKKHADRVVVSIYVNPTQFGPNEDLDKYPRDFAHDEACCQARGVDAVFYPDNAVMYCPDHSCWVTEESLSQTMCGAARPGHFRGVTTVVLKLFNITQCNVAVFGRKDAQQALIIQRMVRDLNVPVSIIVAPLVRAPDGLAMSSRNKYLSSDERQRALSISAGLKQAAALFAGGERQAAALCELVSAGITKAGGNIDYVVVMDRDTLRPLTTIDRPAVLAVAAFFGKPRLIDNVFLD
ncbi:MAG: pantoate--beta-alanine ligase [Lentisphaerae bacterium]|nr:pantoate--beta-alanine ligase [Lentisphaerota bacterium]